MGSRIQRYEFTATPSGISFVEGQSAPVDIGSVGLAAHIVQGGVPPLTSISNVRIATSSGSGNLSFNLAGSDFSWSADGTQIIWHGGSFGTVTQGAGFLNVSYGVIRPTETPDNDLAGNLPSTLSTLADLLSHIEYFTSSNTPGTSVTIQYTFSGDYPYNQPSVTLSIAEFDTLPTFTATGTNANLGAVAAGGTSAEFAVSSFRPAIVDADGPSTGIAITATGAANAGTWQYSIDNGQHWSDIGTVSATSALLLRDSDLIRFVGNAQSAADATFTYRPWDQYGAQAGNKVDPAGNFGIGIATYASTATLHVLAVNDAPVLTPSAPALPAITEDDIGNAGLTVASFASAGISDADGPAKGIAITSLVEANGHWDYSLDGGAHWAAIGPVSAGSALLLRDTDLIRFNPDGRNGTDASLTYRAWDQTSGAAGNRVDPGAGGGATAFSTATDTATLHDASVNDPATVSVTPVSVVESDAVGLGLFYLADKVTMTDPDFDPPGVKYVAGSATISDATGPTPPARALTDYVLLDATTGAVTYDRAAFQWLAPGQSVVYTITFAVHPFNEAPHQETLTFTVSGANDAPVLFPVHHAMAPITEDAAGLPGQAVASLRGPIQDNDPGSPAGIAITATAGNGEWQYSIDNGASWHSFTASDAAALLLRDEDLVRFAPDGNNGGPASFTYHAWDQTSGTAGGTVDASVTGGSSAVSHAADTVTLAVTSVNDAPVLVPDHMTLLPITEDDVANAGQPVWTFLCDAISDVDNGAVHGIALTGTANGNGHWEYSLDGGSSWVSVGSVGEGAALLLKGDDWMRFVPDGRNGTSATLTYHAWDQTSGTHGQSVDLTAAGATGGTTAFSTGTDTVSVAVSDVNDPPVVSGPVALTAVNEDTPRLITQAELLAHASDADTVHTLTAADLQIASGGGTLADNHDGTWSYTPARDDDTSVSFSFTVSDGIAAPVPATATLDLLPVNDPPVAQDGRATGNEDTPITGTVTANDVDTPAGALTYALVGQNGGAQHGTVTLNPNGSYTYTPERDFNGTDRFSFKASDGQAGSAAAAISITVDPVNDPPAITTATPLSVAENQTFVAALGATDVDGPNAATYRVTGGADAALFDIVGTNLVFRNAHDYETDPHSYQVEITAFDGLDSSSRLLTVDLTDVNDNAPVFTSNTSAPDLVPESTQGTVFSATAIDADGSASITYSLSGDDAALFTIDPVTGKVRFVTAPDYEAPKDRDHDNNYQVTLHANDGVHDATQDLTVTVTNINEAPVATNGSASGERAISGHVSATDVDSPMLTYTTVSGPAHGTLSLNANGTFSYAADLTYHGADAFTFKANDGALDSNVATFSLDVTQQHLAGTAGNDSVTADGGNERIDGGGGVNTVTFSFKLTDATISFAGNQIIVDGPNSHTVLTDFTIFRFTDGTVDNTRGNPLIDKLYYYAQNHDVWNAHADAEQHFMTAGWKEGRNPDALFDTNGYLAHNPDVAASGINPLTHYDRFGWQEGRDPSASFDTRAYLAANPDIAVAHIDPLAHFLQYGIHEGRMAFVDGHF